MTHTCQHDKESNQTTFKWMESLGSHLHLSGGGRKTYTYILVGLECNVLGVGHLGPLQPAYGSHKRVA